MLTAMSLYGSIVTRAGGRRQCAEGFVDFRRRECLRLCRALADCRFERLLHRRSFLPRELGGAFIYLPSTAPAGQAHAGFMRRRRQSILADHFSRECHSLICAKSRLMRVVGNTYHMLLFPSAATATRRSFKIAHTAELIRRRRYATGQLRRLPSDA